MALNGTLTAKQNALLLALVSGQPIEAAALSANVSRRTAFRWQKLPAFQAELTRAKAAAFEKTLTVLRDGVGAALNTLARNMREAAPPAVQVRAASVWMETAIALFKLNELETKLTEIELLLLNQPREMYEEMGT